MALIPGIVLAAAAGFLALRGPNAEAVPSLQEVSDRTISPYCAPLTLSECPSGKASELRAEIGQKIEAGWTNERIDDWLVANFGAWLVKNPGSSIAELFPAVAILTGSVLVAVFLSRRSSSQGRELGEGDPSTSDLSDVEQMHRELAEFRTASE